MNIIYQRIVVILLAVIAVNLTVTNMNSLRPSKTSFQPKKPVLLRVLSEASTNYDAMGLGASGYIVEGSNGLEFIERNELGEPRLSPDTKYILRTSIDADYSVYMPILSK
ncbi:MAG: hypothetical protein RLY57_233 [Candidatus Parcubacteria bacterium]|jgi:hypothetical protein